MISGDLAQSIAEIQQAKQDIESLAEKLETAVSQAESLETAEQECKQYCNLINQIYESSRQTAELADNEIKSVQEAVAGSQNLLKMLTETGRRIDEVEGNAKSLHEQLQVATDSAQQSAETIKSLLPEATSAGLAASFGNRARTVSNSIKWWSGGFLAGIGLLIVGIVASVYFFDAPSDKFDWLTLVRRLVFAAPGVWLAWYCARGMSTAIKLRESYAFKEAMSRAFEGYKKQMVDLDAQYQGSDLAAKLSESVLAIMATDPIAILSKPDEDGHSPWEAAYRRVSRRGKSTQRPNQIAKHEAQSTTENCEHSEDELGSE